MSQKPPEKRLRLRRRDETDKGIGKLNTATMKFLQITDKMEIVVAGKKKAEYKAISLPDIPENEIWANTAELKILGLADNSIATVRKA